jgi:tetratricopeptide (TPR) repeat protein
VEYARFGTALLIDRAQSVSLEARSADDYCEAARLYEQVAALHERQPEAAPAQLRAYTIHYLHFNRARAESEPIYETRRGYAQATELWPEHARFWSRLVRTLIYEGRHAEAHTALQDALQRVPEHPNKLPTLIGRTVRRLLQRGLLLDAAEIWGDYEPTAMADRPIKRQLQDRLQTGWTTDQLSFVGGPSLTFTRPVRLVVQLIQAGLWSAAIEGDVARARGPSPVAALRALIARARARCDELLRAFTHTLDAPARMEKQVLFGLVDVVRSGLDAPPPRRISVLGNLRRVEGALALHTVGSRHDVLPLSDAQARAHVASEQLWIAEVRGGPGGLPEGPILRLTPAVEADEEASLLAAWERRLANAD